MSIFAISLIIFLGILLVLVEFLVIPGVTVAGIGGFLLIGGGIYSGYHFHDMRTGNIILLVSIGVMLVAFILALKVKTWQKMGLKATIDGKVNTLEEDLLKVGDTGKTISRLAPMGKAMFKNKLFEVKTEGSFVDQNKEITIIRISKNQIIVEPKN